MVMQPFPSAFGKATEERGGNSMGLTGKDHARFVLEIAGIHTHKADDNLMLETGKAFTDQLAAKVKQVRAPLTQKN